MSLTLAEIFALNPSITVSNNDLFYLVHSPYAPGDDSAILGSDLKAAMGVGTVTSISQGTGITLTPNPITTTGSIALTVPVTEILGGTNQTTYTLGDTLYSSAANTLSKLAGNITAVKQYLSQTGTGAVSAPPVWTTIAGADITGAALTKTDDTNVTLTLGGTPTTALLRATSLTLGWTGQLSLTRGGTAASLTADNGGIFYSTATAGAILSGTATARQMLQSGANAAPAWSTATWPATTTANQILFSSATNTVGEITTVASSILVTSAGSVPSFSTTLPAFTTSSITFSPTTGGIVGTTTNDNVAAGKVGEFVSSVIPTGSPVTLTNNTAANVTSVSLTAGDWNVWGNVGFLPGTTCSYVGAWTSATSATLPDYSLRNSIANPTINNAGLSTPFVRYSLSTTTTIYLSCQASIASTCDAVGGIFARRIR